jgi:hypothetical protein
MRVLLLFLMSSWIWSCKKQEQANPTALRQWVITQVQGQATASVHQTASFVVSWPYSNGCDYIERFDQQQSGNTFSIKMMGGNRGGLCTQDAGIKTTNFQFMPHSAGTYTLRFLSADGNTFTHTLVVN